MGSIHRLVIAAGLVWLALGSIQCKDDRHTQGETGVGSGAPTGPDGSQSLS